MRKRDLLIATLLDVDATGVIKFNATVRVMQGK